MAQKFLFYALGTENSITLESENAEDVAEKIIARVRNIEEKMSAFKSKSEVAEISRCAGRVPVRVSDELFYILETALEISRVSKGAFDVTVRPLTSLWNIGKGTDVIPKESEIEKAKSLVGYETLVLDSQEKTAFLTKLGGALDLGGIAKGYAADEAKRILLDNGINKGLINFGGNIVTVGSGFDRAPWKIGIQNPLSTRSDYVTTLEIENKSIVTSAVNERFFIKDSMRYHHIISPLTGYPAQSELLSVTVIDDCSMTADVLSTAAYVLGLLEGSRLIKQFGAQAIFITQNGDILSTFEGKAVL